MCEACCGSRPRTHLSLSAFFAETTAELGWERAGGSDLLSVDEGLASVVNRFHVQFDLLALPLGRNTDEAAISRVTVLGRQGTAQLAFP